MKIASAQIESIVGDIDGNLNKHLNMINEAVKKEVDLIVFPEMSLSGYCRREGKKLAIATNHYAITQLKEKAKKHDIIIIVGASIKLKNALFIGSYILLPDGKIEIYTKQYLHSGEEEFYASSFDYNPQIKLGKELISFAICADIDNEKHPLNAKNNHTTLYIASIFFSKNGIDAGLELLAKYARTYSLNILMSNYSGKTWGLEAGGKSAFWDKTGTMTAVLDTESEALLVVDLPA